MNIGDILKNRYEITELLGEGGMAFVYKALDRELQRFVAIKTLKPSYVGQESFVERFKREAQVASNINNPNIVQIFDWGIEDVPYFVMEYVEGNSLTQILSKKKQLSISDVIYIGSRVANGLHAAHSNGLVHRDIKPGNILITSEGRVKVTDFGIVAIQDESSDITKTGSVLGTATYISPEQAKGESVSSQSDLYSLGIVLYELLLGKPPFEGESPVSIATKHLTDKPEKLSGKRSDIPRGLENAILKLLSKNSADRFKSAEDLRAVLIQQNSVLKKQETQESLIDLASPSIKLRFSIPALLVSLGLFFGVFWTLSNVFKGLPPDGGSQISVEIPDLTGSEQAQALKDLQSFGFKVGIENAAHPDVPTGAVIKTQPTAGTSLSPEGLVTIIVSVGPEAFPVPYIVDIELDRAIYVIEQSGFVIGQQLEANDNNVPRGFVISQNPAAGTKLGPNSVVDLVISSGPNKIELGDLSRKSQEDAMQILETLGFKYELLDEFSEDIEMGLVAYTIPQAGSIVSPQEIITIVISLGLQIEVPDLIGLSYAEVEEALLELNLIPSVIGGTSGNVSEQVPEPGEFVDPDSLIEITFEE
jgi:serine/threonine protein kinase